MGKILAKVKCPTPAKIKKIKTAVADSVGGLNPKSGLTKGNIQDYLNNAASKTPQEIAKDLQAAGLKLKGSSPDGRFMEFVDRFGNVRAKIHPADKVTKYPHLHIYDKAGNALNKALDKVSPKSPGGHIPTGN